MRTVSIVTRKQFVEEYFDSISDEPDWSPCFNVTPTQPVPAPRPRNICAGCGSSTKGGQNCSKCGRAISRQRLIDIAKLGRVIGHSAHSRKKQSEAMKRHDVAKREWPSTPKPSWPTEQVYLKEILPRLSTVTIAKIAPTLLRPHERSGRHSGRRLALLQVLGYKEGADSPEI